MGITYPPLIANWWKAGANNYRGLSLAQWIQRTFAGVPGVNFAPSPSTCFQDVAGTVPCVVGDPVGLLMDTSGNASNASQATAASRPILRLDATGHHYLEFDGVDDGLVTAPINFSATDKATVCTGVRKLTDAAQGMIVEINTAGAAGTFFLVAPDTIGFPNYRFQLQGSLVAKVISANAVAPTTNVVTGLLDIAGATPETEVVCRLNGVAGGVASGGAGTGNLGSYALYIGRRAGLSLPLNGHLYGLFITGALATTFQVQQIERYEGSLCGIAL